MAITGHLAEFSLSEIFQFLAQGNKTGLLTVMPESRSHKPSKEHYIWFRQGHVVAAANRSDYRGLTRLICQRGWLSDRAALRLVQCCPSDKPLGVSLKTHGIVNASQLKLLFYIQVMRQVCALFALPDARFHFDNKAQIPYQELTGLHATAQEVTLAGLRVLKNWAALKDKLPDAASALVNVVEGKPAIKLSSTEWQVWKLTDGHTSLRAIASQLSLPIDKLQQVAFRLIVAGLVDELPTWGQSLNAASHTTQETTPISSFPMEHVNKSHELSPSFFQNLVNFLKGHGVEKHEPL
ncbi:MAG: DUF4388 domain-containing protein [Elainellaceae cyanobacterium]